MAKKDEKKLFWGVVGTAFLLAIIAGAFAGVISSVFTDQSLQQYFESLSGDERLAVISEVKPRPLPGTYEEALSRVQESAWPALASIRVASEDTTEVSELIHADDVIGHGAVVTSDGWIAFHVSVFEILNDASEDIEIWVRGERYQVEEVVTGPTDFVMVNVDAQDLPALAFGASDQVNAGAILFAVTGNSSLTPTSLRDAEFSTGELVTRAEQFETRWELHDPIVTSGPLFNSAGELVGLAGGVTQATPLHHGLPFVHAVLRDAGTEAPGMGAYVVDIDSVLNVDASLVGTVSAGALIIAPDARTPAVLPGGPADLAGLQEGDVVLAIDGTSIAQNVSLAEAISDYRPEDTAVLSVFRNLETIEIPITFANLSDLLY